MLPRGAVPDIRGIRDERFARDWRLKTTDEWAVVREERRVFLSNAPAIQQRKVNPLDPIAVAGQACMEQIRKVAQSVPDPWGPALAKHLAEGFPRKPGHPEHARVNPPHQCVVKDEYLPNIRPLVKAKHATRGTTLLVETTERVPRGWVGYFQVPKTAEVDRAIVNCTSTNEGYVEPPPLRLAEYAELLALIKSYGPSARVLTSDIRHFFWQITLPNGDRRYFCTAFDGKKYEWVCLPMGWTWSPWVAQGVASLAVYAAVQTLNSGEEGPFRVVRGGGDPNSPAPFYHIMRKAEGHQPERRVASIVIWYDNFLVLTNDDAAWTDTLRRAIDVAAKRLKLAWKPLKGSKRWWQESKGSGEYVGIQFRWQEGAFQWRHLEENAQDWLEATERVVGSSNLHTVAMAMGVLVHDAALRISRGRGPNIHALMSSVGKAYATVHRSKWGETELPISTDQRDALQECWAQLTDNEWQEFEQWNSAAFVASDATTTASAYFLMEANPNRSVARPRGYKPVQCGNFGETDINKIEALVAIKSIRAAADHPEVGAKTLIVATVDNTTAVAWLNGRGCPDARIYDELESMRRHLEERGCGYVVMWVDTNEQPADEPSRGKEVDAAKVRACLAHAKQWFAETFGSAEAIHQAQSVLKRGREEGDALNV
jgi:hypothetical protein